MASAKILLVALATTLAAPAAAHALGFAGCFDLPEYNRALGTLQGLSTCGMTVEEARRVVAAHDGPAAAQQVAPTQLVQHPRHRKPSHHRTTRDQ